MAVHFHIFGIPKTWKSPDTNYDRCIVSGEIAELRHENHWQCFRPFETTGTTPGWLRVEKPALLEYPGTTLEAIMRKHAFSTAKDLVSIRVPKKLAGKRVVLVDAAEYAALKRRLAEVSDALEKISRGDAAYRQGRTKTVSSLAELGR